METHSLVAEDSTKADQYTTTEEHGDGNHFMFVMRATLGTPFVTPIARRTFTQPPVMDSAR